MTLRFSKQHIMEMFEARLQHQTSRLDALEGKAQLCINIGGIFVAVVTGLSLFDPHLYLLDKVLLVIILVLFFGVLCLEVFSLYPRDWCVPLKISKEKYYTEIKGWLDTVEPDIYFDAMADTYVDSIDRNEKTLTLKSNAVNIMLIMVGMELFLTAIFAYSKVF